MERDGQGRTHQHAVVAVLVQQQHACLEAHGDLLPGGAPVVGVEDCFAADAGDGAWCQSVSQFSSVVGSVGVDWWELNT